MLKDFLARFNARFGVSARHAQVAYRPLASGVRHSSRVARDNTVKCRWRTLQLLPGMEHSSFAGAVGEVLEGLNGKLAVLHRDRSIPSQEAPPRPGILRSFNGPSSHESAPRPDLYGLGRRWPATLIVLDAHAGDADDSGAVSARKTVPVSRSKPNPLQTARWNAVQKAKRRGLSIRGIARELGIQRDTTKKYMEAASPPMKRLRVDSE